MIDIFHQQPDLKEFLQDDAKCKSSVNNIQGCWKNKIYGGSILDPLDSKPNAMLKDICHLIKYHLKHMYVIKNIQMTDELYMDIQLLYTSPDPSSLSEEFDKWYSEHTSGQVVQFETICKYLNGYTRANVFKYNQDNQKQLVNVTEGKFENGQLDGYGRKFISDGFC